MHHRICLVTMQIIAIILRQTAAPWPFSGVSSKPFPVRQWPISALGAPHHPMNPYRAKHPVRHFGETSRYSLPTQPSSNNSWAISGLTMRIRLSSSLGLESKFILPYHTMDCAPGHPQDNFQATRQRRGNKHPWSKVSQPSQSTDELSSSQESDWKWPHYSPQQEYLSRRNPNNILLKIYFARFPKILNF